MKNLLKVFLATTTVSVIGLVAACTGDDTNPTSPPDATADGTTSETSVPEAGNDSGDAQPDAPGFLPTGAIDRAGRAGVIWALVTESVKNDAGVASASKDGYNKLDTFATLTNPYLADFQKNLVTLDLADGVNDWDGGPAQGITTQVPVDAGPDADGGTTSVTTYPHRLVSVMRGDTLIVDTAKPFSPTGYMDIEFSGIVGAPGSHTTCGGRWIGEDIVDKMMSIVVKRATTGVSDGVSAPTKAASLTFPYFAAAN